MNHADVFDSPDWQFQAKRFLASHESELKLGVVSMSRMILWSLESDANLTVPEFSVDARCFRMRWEFSDGGVFNVLVVGASKFRYRFMNSKLDTGVVTVFRDYAESTRKIFKTVFMTNQVTQKAMEYHLGKAFE